MQGAGGWGVLFGGLFEISFFVCLGFFFVCSFVCIFFNNSCMNDQFKGTYR